MFTVVFIGNSISYVGDISPDFAYTQVSIDGGPIQFANNEGPLTLQQVLWSGANLVEGDHQIIITRDIDAPRWWMTLDYLQLVHCSQQKVS